MLPTDDEVVHSRSSTRGRLLVERRPSYLVAGWAFSAETKSRSRRSDASGPNPGGPSSGEPRSSAFAADDETVPQAPPTRTTGSTLRSYEHAPDLRIFTADDESRSSFSLNRSEAPPSAAQDSHPGHQLWEFTEELPPTPTLGGFEDGESSHRRLRLLRVHCRR